MESPSRRLRAGDVAAMRDRPQRNFPLWLPEIARSLGSHSESCESASRTQAKRHPTRRNEARHHEPAPQPADRYRILRNKGSILLLRRRNLVVSARPLYFAVAQEGTRLSSATK